MNKRYLIAFVLTALVYGVSFLAYSYSMDSFDTSKNSGQIAQLNSVVKVALYTPPSPKPIKKEEIKKFKKPDCDSCELMNKKVEKVKPVKKEIKKEVIVKKEAPKKIQKPKEKPKKVVHKPKKIKKQKEKPKKVVHKPKEIKKQIQKKQIVKHTPTPKKQTAQVVQKASTTKVVKKERTNLVQQKVDIQKQIEEKNRYLSNVKKIIESNKFYPNSAKRRGIQSNIPVKFTILTNGMMVNLEILGGKKIFHKSVRDTIKKSFPLNPNGALNEEIEVSLVLKYNLI